MSSVGRRIDQDVLRLCLQSALDHSLEILVFDLKFFKRQIVHIDDKTVIAVLDFRDDALQILELVLVDFDHAESLAVVAVQDRLDAGGFAGARVAVQKNVIGHAAVYKGLCVGDQLLLLQIIADQILQLHVACGGDRNEELLFLIVVIDAEGLIEAEFADAVFLVKAGDDVVHLLLGTPVLLCSGHACGITRYCSALKRRVSFTKTVFH